MYANLTIVVDGALEIDEDFTDDTLLRERLRDISNDAAIDGLPTQVYVMQHDHPLDQEDCDCVQYLQDHRPTHTFNMNQS